MTIIGYARVSTADQNPDAQTDALEAQGCARIFIDHASGTLAARPQLAEMVRYLRPGDRVIVTKLDRLGRSVKHLTELAQQFRENDIDLVATTQGIDTSTPGGRLFFHMLAAIAEFEHDLIVERTKDGLTAARSRGRKGGPTPKVTPLMAQQMQLMYDSQRGLTVQQIAEAFGVTRATVYRYIKASDRYGNRSAVM